MRSDENGTVAGGRARAAASLPDHPVRTALLDLLAEVGTVTATEAAQRLGQSSGLCSFHLRQLARHGLIEEAPHEGGRARPWRLRWGSPEELAPAAPAPPAFDELARGLEDESYRRWLSHRDEAPAEWRQDEAFSTILRLTPAELAEVAEAVRRLLAGYQERAARPAADRGGAVPVAVVTRLFPLLADDGTGRAGDSGPSPQ